MRKIALLLAIALSGCGQGETTQTTKRVAFNKCLRVVADELNSPATAQFSSFDDSSVSVLKTITDTHGAISTTYQIIGYVDAHNGLGEIVRSHYSCQITGKPDNIWVVRSFEIV